jgi:hypothetical protein
MVVRRTAENRLTAEAAEFVRFCYRRRPVGWPELYDEMCAVAMRRLFRGWDTTELARHGIGFSLEETPILAELVERVVAEEQAAKRAARAARPLGPLRDPEQGRSGGTEARSEVRAGVAGVAAS